MCATCGCDEGAKATISVPGQQEHQHIHPSENQERSLSIEQNVLQKNNLLAERNRGYFEAKGIFCVNLVSSPGSGKTALLEQTIQSVKERTIAVIEGDQQTQNDADRIQATGARVIQVNTGNGCHLEADMIHHAVLQLNPEEGSILVIENVGNLVCPALFDLGETHRVVIMSVTEGEDKPLKYPNMFATSQVCIINKIDLLPYLDFDLEKAKAYARQVNPHIRFIELSATKGTNVEEWCHWLTHHQPHVHV